MPDSIRSLVYCTLNHYVYPVRYAELHFRVLMVSHEIRLYLRVDNTFTFSNCQTLAILLPCGIVVDRFPVRDFDADHPISMIFILSRLSIFHLYVVVHRTLRAFQQLNKIFNIRHRIKSHLHMISSGLRSSMCGPPGMIDHTPSLH